MNWKNLKRKASHLTAPLTLAAAMTSSRPTKAQDIYAETILRGIEVLQPVPVTLGNVAIGQSKNFDIKYSSGGTCHVIVDELTITGRDANDFKIVSDVTGHVAWWKYPPLMVTVQFTPSHAGLESIRMDLSAHAVERCGLRLSPKQLIGFGVGGQSQVYRPQPPVNPDQLPKRAFFYIAYLNDDKTNPGHYQSFVDAAKTWEDEIKQKYNFKEGQDRFIEAKVLSVSEFAKAWNEINQTVLQEHYVVEAGAIFSHSSVMLSTHPPYYVIETGLEFGSEPGVDPASAGSTVSLNIIESLPRLNWDTKGNLELFGCNTAVGRGFYMLNWSPSGEFAKVQHVVTIGEDGFAYFSENKDRYVPITSGSKNVYLEAFRRGKI